MAELKEYLFRGFDELPREEGSYTNEASLSPLADYVLNELPRDLSSVREGATDYAALAAKHEVLIGETLPAIDGNIDPTVAQATQLDLLFMFGSYIPAGEDMYKIAPPRLMPLIAQQRDKFGIEDYMTYELIIDGNYAEYQRTGSARVFSEGPIGKQERDFYLGHHAAERWAKAAAYKLHEYVERPTLTDAETILRDVSQDMGEFYEYMAAYGRLVGFADFRPYLATYADGKRNASGAFMPSVQLFELSLLRPSEMHSVFVDESMPYFPGWSRQTLETWRQQSLDGVNLEDLLTTGVISLDANAKGFLMDAVHKFGNFRNKHLNVTAKRIPDAFPDGERPPSRKEILEQTGENQILDAKFAGTAGFDVHNVLTNSVYRIFKLLERLEQL